MLKKFIQGSVLAQAFTRSNLSGPERLAQSALAKATTPDHLIVAHILQEYVKNPKDWKATGEIPQQKPEGIPTSSRYTVDEYRRGDRTTWYKTSAAAFLMYHGNTRVAVRCCVKNKDGDGIAPWFVRFLVEVNSITLSQEASDYLLKNLKDIMAQTKAAQEAAALALREMELNEAKWNLAETLLGMKRNEHGALVPIQSEDQTHVQNETQRLDSAHRL